MERMRGNAASASRHFEEDFSNVALLVVSVAALFLPLSFDACFS